MTFFFLSFFTSSCGLNSLTWLISMPGTIAEDFNQRGVLLINRGSASGVVCIPGSGEEWRWGMGEAALFRVRHRWRSYISGERESQRQGDPESVDHRRSFLARCGQ